MPSPIVNLKPKAALGVYFDITDKLGLNSGSISLSDIRSRRPSEEETFPIMARGWSLLLTSYIVGTIGVLYNGALSVAKMAIYAVSLIRKEDLFEKKADDHCQEALQHLCCLVCDVAIRYWPVRILASAAYAINPGRVTEVYDHIVHLADTKAKPAGEKAIAADRRGQSAFAAVEHMKVAPDARRNGSPSSVNSWEDSGYPLDSMGRERKDF